MNRHFKALSYFFLSMICVSPPVLSETEKAEDAASAADSLNKRREAVEAEWKKHRSQHIAVLDIDGLKASDSGDEKGSLERRLETLQNKKLSNREWKTYWTGESEYAEALAQVYDELVNADGSGLTALTTRLDEQSQAKKAEDSRLSGEMGKAMRVRSVAEAEIKAHLEGVGKALDTIAPKLKASSEVLQKLTDDIARLKANPPDEAQGTLAQ